MAERKLGFIGLGVMGSSMASNLLQKGHELLVFGRNVEKVRRISDLGAKVAPTLAELGSRVDTIFLSVSDGVAVREIVDSLKTGLKKGAIIVDLSTIAPQEAKTIATGLEKEGIHFLDAPVSGGDVGARAGTLTIMIGGNEGAYHEVREFLSCIGKKLVHVGPSGFGQMTKAVNQVMVALSVTAMTEGLILAKHAGLDLEKTLDVLRSGAAGSWSLDNYAPRILREEYGPGFYAKHMLKDLRIALEEAAALNMPLPAADLVKELYVSMCATGGENLGNHALITLYEKLRADKTFDFSRQEGV